MSDPDAPWFADLDVDTGGPLDPHDRWADPERTARVSTHEDAYERQERDADALLSDDGSAAINRRRRGDD